MAAPTTTFDFMQDPATIPQVVGPYITITYGIAYMLAPFLFVFAIVTEMTKALRSDYQHSDMDMPKYANIILRTLGVVLGLLLYKTLFLAIVSVCQVLSMYMFSMDTWGQMQSILTTQREIGFLDAIKLSVNEIIVILLVTLAQVAEVIFNVVRYMTLSVFYIAGPVVFVMGIWPGKEAVLYGWFRNLFTVSAWIVILRMLQGALSSVLFAFQIKPDDIRTFASIDFVILAITYIGMVVATPSLTGILLSGEGLGHLGTILMAGVGGLARKVISTSGTAARVTAGLQKIPGIGKLGPVQRLSRIAGVLSKEIGPDGTTEGKPSARTAPKVKVDTDSRTAPKQ